MKKITRKELRQNTEEMLRTLLNQFEISAPSKRTKKVVEKVSKRFSSTLKQEIKKKMKQNQKASRKIKHNGKADLKSVAA
jgi:flagellar hook-basal body complex protein FliE